VLTDCACSPVRFMVEGPIGEEAYKQANAIAKLIEDDNPRLTLSDLHAAIELSK